MRIFDRVLRLVAFLFLSALSALAQSAAVDPTGHWEGTIQAPSMEVSVEIDLAKNSAGQLAGTFTQPAEGVKGLPLSTVAVEGRTVRMLLKPGGSGGGTFEATIAADGKSMSGSFTMTDGGHVIPFSLTRTGEARIASVPKSPAIGKELEGAWNGVLDIGERQMRLLIKMANQPDGTATGTVVSQDGTGVEIPIAMTQKGASLTVEVPSVGATFAGVLNTAGTELAGTWTQGPSAFALTLTRAAK